MPEISYVLVHGGHNDSSVWNGVIPFLKDAGCSVFAPTLAEPEKTTLKGHIREVCSLIEKNCPGKVILVGHSYAAMVITGVCTKMPDKISKLIYLDSAFPKSGDSLIGILKRCGVPVDSFGLIPERPLTDRLFFDEETVRKVPKVYVHCTKSEFIAAGKCTYEEIKRNAQKDNWALYELESPHHCMKAMPKEVSEIILGTYMQ